MRNEQSMENAVDNTITDTRKRLIEALTKAVEKLCPVETLVEMQEMEKNNGIIKLGMVVDGNGKKITPVIYLEPYLERIEAGDSTVEEMAAMIYEVYQNQRREKSDMDDGFVTVELVKERVIYQLISLEKNRKWLKHMPYRIIGEDLAAVFVLLLGNNHSGMTTVKMNKEHLKLWGMDEEELWEMANANTPKLLPATFVSLKDVMLDLLKTQREIKRTVFDEEAWDALFEPYSCLIDRKESQNLPLYVLSNSSQTWGASAILYPGVLREAAKKLGGDLLILPSSVHETIIVRQEVGLEYDEIAALVKEINQREVLPEDVLSDSIYLYNREMDTIERIAV